MILDTEYYFISTCVYVIDNYLLVLCEGAISVNDEY